jgi:hypothetical protein
MSAVTNSISGPLVSKVSKLTLQLLAGEFFPFLARGYHGLALEKNRHA